MGTNLEEWYIFQTTGTDLEPFALIRHIATYLGQIGNYLDQSGPFSTNQDQPLQMGTYLDKLGHI